MIVAYCRNKGREIAPGLERICGCVTIILWGRDWRESPSTPRSSRFSSPGFDIPGEGWQAREREEIARYYIDEIDS